MNRIKLIILLFIINISFAAHDDVNKVKVADNRAKQSESKLAESKSQIGDYLSQVTDIPALQNLIADYLKQWVNVKTLTGHTDAVSSVAYSPDYAKATSGRPDNKYLASGSSDGTIKIWDVNNNYNPLHTLRSHTAAVSSVAYSPDNKYLASASYDKTIKIYNVNDNYKILHTLTGHYYAVSSVAYSPDNKYLVSGSWNSSWNNTINIYDVNNNYKLLHTLTGHIAAITSLSYSPDNKYLASGSADKTINIWQYIVPYSDAKDNQKKADDTAKNNEFKSTESTNFGDYLSHVTDIPGLKNLIEDYLKQWVNVKTLTGHTRFINSVTYSPDNKYLASGSADNTIKIWDVNDNYKLLHNLTDHTGAVTSVVYSPDNKYLASASEDSTIKIWDTTTYKLLQTLNVDSLVYSISFNRNGKYLAGGDLDGNIKIWHYEGIE